MTARMAGGVQWLFGAVRCTWSILQGLSVGSQMVQPLLWQGMALRGGWG